MKLERADRAISSSGVMETAKATIKATPKIFNFFADQTYANKPRAIARELVANGIDSHTAAGCPDRPVEVTLPTDLDPVFKVRDFGTGMTHEFMMTRFMAYTDGSTKDQSNDQIGGFGIGSKSPFAYTDQYTLRVVCEGVLSVYTMFKDEEGLPSIGLMGQTTTDEHNGVEVSFPVEADDHAKFHEAAQEALQFFQPLPIVINGTLTPPPYNYVGKGWMLRPTAGDLNVIMGGVRYPVATNSLDYKLRYDDKLGALLSYGLDLILPIGACGIALSREALSYDGTTSDNIRKGLEAVIDDVVKTFANMFDNQPTMWQAMVALHKETNGATNSSGRAKLLAANAYWRGAKIEANMNVQQRVGIATAWMIEKASYRKTTIGSAKWEDMALLHFIHPGHVGVVIVDDLPVSGKSKQIMKIKEYVEENVDRNKHQALVLRVAGPDHTDPAAIASMIQKLGGPEYVLTSSMPEPAKASTTTASGRVVYVRPRIRMFQTNGRNDNYGNRVTNLTPGHAKTYTGAVKEIAYADQPTSGIMVAMNNFDMPGDVRGMVDSGLLTWSELFFVNQADVSKVKAHFTDYKEVFEKRKVEALAKHPELAARAAVAQDGTIGQFSEEVRLLAKDLSPAQQARPFGRICAAYAKYLAPYDDAQRALAKLIVPKMPAKLNPEALLAAFKKEQPEAKILLDNLQLKEQTHRALILKNL